MEHTRYPKARRLVLLYHLRMAGVLGNLTLRQIAEILGVSRATLLGDFRDLDLAEAEFRELMQAQPWRQYGTVPDREFDGQVETLKRLTRDGLVWLQHWVTPRDADA